MLIFLAFLLYVEKFDAPRKATNSEYVSLSKYFMEGS